jgi:SAM-dependent methyltransferase
MRDLVRAYVELVAGTVPLPEPIYEFGAYLVTGQESLADLRPLFQGRAYVGCDMRAGPGVDKVLDLRKLDLPDGSVGSVLMFDTLEHVELPHDALREVERVLRPGGIVVMTSVMDFPIHDFPFDYWRFTPEAFRSLLQRFASRRVAWAGVPWFPHTIVGVGVKGPAPDLSRYDAGVEEWKRRWHGPDARLLARIARAWVPPALMNLYWRRAWLREVRAKG